MPKSTKKTSTLPLTGNDLLSRLEDLGRFNKSEIARACGYVTCSKSGTERLQMREFMNALLEAKGIRVDANHKSNGGESRKLRYRVSVQQNGGILIGSAYTKEMGMHPGDRFEITLGRTNIKLTAIDDDVID